MHVKITVKTAHAETATELEGSPDEVLAVMFELGMLAPIENQYGEEDPTIHWGE